MQATKKKTSSPQVASGGYVPQIYERKQRKEENITYKEQEIQHRSGTHGIPTKRTMSKNPRTQEHWRYTMCRRQTGQNGAV